MFVETKGRSLEEIDAVFGDVSHAEVMQAAEEKVANTSFEEKSNVKKDESDLYKSLKAYPVHFPVS